MIGFELHWAERLPEDLVDQINEKLDGYHEGTVDADDLREELLSMDMTHPEVEGLIEELEVEDA